MVEIQEIDEKKVSAEIPSKVDQFNELMCKMSKAREKWMEEEENPNDPDHLLNHAINLALEQGRGWGPGEKEAYLEKILDDDFIPPIFANSPEEVEKSGLQEAFTSLIYDNESPTSLMLQFRKKGSDCFANGKRNQVKNVQYYRDAINHWYECFAWAQKIVPMQEGDFAQIDTSDPTYTEPELDELKSTICCNIALAHLMLSNWGHVRDECKKALIFNDKNVKAWYRLAKAYQMLKDWEAAGTAIDSGFAVPGEEQNKDLLKLQKQLAEKVRKARHQRQQRERARAERVSKVKAVWKHCQIDNKKKIHMGRVPLVASVTDDEDKDDLDEDEQQESRWHNHFPHSGLLPTITNGEWYWPCMFLYPSHNQSDFIQNFGESEMMAVRMAEVFPELDEGQQETSMKWDYNNEFTCSQLAVYFEVHETAVEAQKNTKTNVIVHPESVELLKDQASCMRYYESSRALKGDEGAEMTNLVRLLERKHLSKQRRAWKKEHGSLWAKPDPSPVVRIHPAMTLREVLTDPRMVVPSVSKRTQQNFACDSNCASNIYLLAFLLAVPGHLHHFPRESPCTRGLFERAQMRRCLAAIAKLEFQDKNM
jgi:Cns1/TTC4 Wheel domain